MGGERGHDQGLKWSDQPGFRHLLRQCSASRIEGPDFILRYAGMQSGITSLIHSYFGVAVDMSYSRGDQNLASAVSVGTVNLSTSADTKCSDSMQNDLLIFLFKGKKIRNIMTDVVEMVNLSFPLTQTVSSLAVNVYYSHSSLNVVVTFLKNMTLSETMLSASNYITVVTF